MKIDDLMVQLPAESLVRRGLSDLRESLVTAPACLVSIAGVRLRSAGILDDFGAKVLSDPELRLFHLLCLEGGDAYSRYNSLLRELASFENALDCRIRSLQTAEPER